MKFYISDLHLGHKNVLKFCNRPFETVEEMDEVLINNWNKKVNKDDEVYILGDMIYGSCHHPSYYLERLKGKKHLILGNHEKYLKKIIPNEYFNSVNQYLDTMDKNRRVILFHYPILSWNGMNRQSYHLHGHSHNRTNKRIHERMLNVGVDINNYEPVTLDELIENNNKYFTNVNYDKDGVWDIWQNM